MLKVYLVENKSIADIQVFLRIYYFTAKSQLTNNILEVPNMRITMNERVGTCYRNANVEVNLWTVV